jgi:hypothetical protein
VARWLDYIAVRGLPVFGYFVIGDAGLSHQPTDPKVALPTRPTKPSTVQ